MKYVLFLMMNLFVMDISYSGNKILEDSKARNIVASHISTPLENIYYIEKMTDTKQVEYLKDISSDNFIKSQEFKLLSDLITRKKINLGSILEKRETYFFIDKADSNEKLMVVFERISDGWKPVEIERENKSLFLANHPLFSISLSPTSDNFHFAEFSSYWESKSREKYKIIPSKFEDAVIEHVIFFEGGIADAQVFSIKIGFFLPKNTPETPKNGWLIKEIKKENSKISYDLSKPRNYIPPFRLINMPNNIDNVEMSYNPPPDHGMSIKLNPHKNIVSKVACFDYQDNDYVRVSFYINTNDDISSLQHIDASGEMIVNLQSISENIQYVANNCPGEFIKIESNKIRINTKMISNLNKTEFGKSEKIHYIDFKY